MRTDDLTQWMIEHDAQLAPIGIVKGFHDYLLTLPWRGAGLDWSALPHRELQLDDVTDDDVIAWAEATPLGLHPQLLVIDAADEHGLICSFGDGLRDIDLLSVRPEIYLCGVEMPDNAFEPVHAHFAERRSFSTLRAHEPPTGSA